MPRRVYLVIIGVCAAAVLSLCILISIQPSRPDRWLVATLCMAAWGVVAQLLSHELGRASHSIASIPYLTALFLVPRAEVACAAAVGELIMGIARRRAFPKVIFNVAQVALAVAVGAVLFNLFGGQSLLGRRALNLPAYVAASAGILLINNASVSLVIAVSEARAVRSVWYAMTKGSVINNFLSLPLPYLFGRLFISHGVWGALFLAIPLVAVRQVFLTAWKLESVSQDLLQLMVKAIEARDPYTSGHSQRVQEYATTIGRIVGLSTRQVDRLSRAALLHDVGKIHEIYAPILRKPDKLTPAEWALMQTHPAKSAELVSAVAHLKDIVPSIRHHHESWDGTGYPDCLRGDQIPLFARIIALADMIDAMSTDRPYRRALPIAKVREEIRRMSGAQFDPSICEAMLLDHNFEKMANQITAHTTPGIVERGSILRAG